jgi:hypothetical protein
MWMEGSVSTFQVRRLAADSDAYLLRIREFDIAWGGIQDLIYFGVKGISIEIGEYLR